MKSISKQKGIPLKFGIPNFIHQETFFAMFRVVIKGMKQSSNNEASNQLQCLQKRLFNTFLEILQDIILKTEIDKY